MNQSTSRTTNDRGLTDWREARIIVADDQQFIRSALSRIFSSAGYRHVNVVDSAEAVIECLNDPEQQIDMLVTDIHMGSLSGLALLRAVRCGETAATPNLPVLLVTGENSEKAVGAAILLDASGFISKPIQPARLFEKLGSALGNKVPVKPAVAYRMVAVERADGQDPAALGEEEKPRVNAAIVADPPPARYVLLPELRPGMIMVEPLESGFGGTVLNGNEVLTAKTIRFVRGFAVKRGLDKILVRLPD